MNIDAILVPQGSEYKSVLRGVSRFNGKTPPIFPVPVGVKPLTRYLEKWQKLEFFAHHQQPKVLLMGLCGSLTPRYSVGDVVIYRSCIYGSAEELRDKMCDRAFTKVLYNNLNEKAALVRGFTSDRIIYSASEKRSLGKLYDSEVVDMEGFAALEVLSKGGFSVAMLRVISDDSQQDVPDLNSAISADGSLQSLPLAIGMLRQPIAATRLIRGSLRGLKVLEKVTSYLFAK
ncbi:phosphorylase [Planktothrix sp. FACHB-1355]|uniref:Phosphorylase n=1 Tax=Aerosakkonema funiforme FACHB-1375 TaxID=2949571 RepID=A0A926ZJL3_9CYAN|nr:MULTISPECIES: phosphorylase [Oscillatoriales]MBD2185105.1 phosphorylase [Aerosakkonema funiforme FACHB-1375]MBD3561427.1 phosphorylase [Planktothrix sp. FACHB-1355]